MSPLALIITLSIVVAQIVLPRRLATTPLVFAAFNTSHLVGFGGDFTAVRLCIIIGILKYASQGNFKLNKTDVLLIIFSFFIILSSVGHSFEFGNPYKYRIGLVFNTIGTYMFFRLTLQNKDDFANTAKAIAISVVPLAVSGLIENLTALNPYAFIGARSLQSVVRDGEIRAAGPFGTPILCGTAAATSLAFMYFLRISNKTLANIGIASIIIIILTSRSSTPIASAAIVSCLFFYAKPSYFNVRNFVILCILALLLNAIKDRPIWYIIALVDIVGGSTGWHRAKLIDVSIEHFSEWYLFGTDYTRHWLPYYLPAVPNHCDITNYYLFFGVYCGFIPLTLIALTIKSCTGRCFSYIKKLSDPKSKTQWISYCTIITHAVTALTISYYDQIYVLFFMALASASIEPEKKQ